LTLYNIAMVSCPWYIRSNRMDCFK